MTRCLAHLGAPDLLVVAAALECYIERVTIDAARFGVDGSELLERARTLLDLARGALAGTVP